MDQAASFLPDGNGENLLPAAALVNYRELISKCPKKPEKQ